MTIWDRAGAAFDSGAPIGSAFNIAQSTNDTSQASAAGSAFFKAAPGISSNWAASVTPTLEKQQATPNVFGVTPAQADAYNATQADAPPDAVTRAIGKGLNWADRYIFSPVTDSLEAFVRHANDNIASGSFWDATPNVAGDVKNVSQEWSTSRSNQSTPMQVAWEAVRSNVDNTERSVVVSRPDQHSTAPITIGKATFDKATGRWSYPLLDNEKNQAAQDEYFHSGSQRWITGTGDAIISVYADPTIVGGKAVSGARLAARTAEAADVAHAAEASRAARGVVEDGAAAVKAPAKFSTPARFQTAVQRVSDKYAARFEGGQDGQLASLSQDPLVAQSADAGAIASLMKRAWDLGGTRAERLSRMDDVVYAGAGAQESINRLASTSKLLHLEVKAATAPNMANARTVLMESTDLDHASKLAAMDQDEYMNGLTGALSDELKTRVEALRGNADTWDSLLERVRQSGTGGADHVGAATAGQAAGEIHMVPTTGQRAWASYKAGLAQHVYTYQPSKFLDPIHFVTGRKMPGMLNLAGDDAVDVFDSHARTVAQLARRYKDPDLMAAVNKARDEFVTARGATDPGLARTQRHDIVTELDRAVEKAMTAKHSASGLHSPRDIKDTIDALVNRKNVEVQHAAERAKQAISSDQLFTLHDENGVVVLNQDLARDLSRAASSAQFQPVVGLVDYNRLDRALSTQLRPGMIGDTSRALAGVAHGTNIFLDHVVNDLWKAISLFRPVAYFLRNQLDTQSRAAASTGVLHHAMVASHGLGNFVANMGKVPGEVADLWSKKFAASQELETAEDILKRVDTTAAQKRAAAAARDRAQQTLDLDLATYREQLDAANPPLLGQSVRRRDTVGKKVQGLPVKASKSGDLTTGDLQLSPYSSPGDFLRKGEELDASNQWMGLLSDSAAERLSRLRTGSVQQSGKFKHLVWDPESKADQHLWASAWTDGVNKYMRNDAVNRMILGGASDPTILRWLKETPEGRDYWSAMSKNIKGEDKWASPTELVTGLRANVDAYLPAGQFRQTALARDLTAEDLDQVFPAGVDRPAVPTNMPEAVKPQSGLHSVVDTFDRFRNWYFKNTSTIPEQMMGRHPLYINAFQKHVDRVMSSLGDRGRDTLTLDELHKIRSRADILARKDVGRIIFDTSRKTPMQDALKWISPFYGAWADTMVKWGRLQGENWASLPILWKAYSAPSRFFQVQDADGNIIKPDGSILDPVTGKKIGTNTDPFGGYWVVGLPKFMSDWSNKTFGTDQIKVSRNSANVIFQGDPFWLPGPGPMLAVPVNTVLQSSLPELFGVDGSQIADSALGKWVLPFGESSDPIANQFAPSWVQSTREALLPGNEHTSRYAQVYVQQLAELANQQALGLSPKMTQAETQAVAAKRTRNWLLLRMVGSQSPVSTRPGDPLEFYFDQFHKYQAQYGANAEEQFLQDYPDYAAATVSLNVNETGIQATTAAQRAANKYKTEIAAHKEFGWAIAGPESIAPGKFSGNVYTEQVAAGYRTKRDPVEALNQVQAEQGWSQYNAFMTQMHLTMEQNGITSLRSNAGAGLANVKRQFVAELQKQNPAWMAAYGADKGDTQAKFLAAMQDSMKSSPGLAKRQDMKVLQQYMAARAGMRAVMAELGVGSLTVGTDNADGSTSYADSPGGRLRQTWDQFTSSLLAQSPVFESMYNRARLDDDTLASEVGSG